MESRLAVPFNATQTKGAKNIFTKYVNKIIECGTKARRTVK